MTVLRIGVVFYGLGNQMMSYLYYKARTELTGEKIILWAPEHQPLADHNGYELDKIFGIYAVCHFWQEILWKIYIHRNHRLLKAFVSVARDQLPNLSEPRKGSKLVHFIMAGDKDRDFYIKRRKEILQIYRFNYNIINKESKHWLEQIQNTPNSCSLHIRRGDYIGHPNFDGICTSKYYQNALADIRKRIADKVCLFVFSDDIQWCREKFGTEDFFYIDCNHGKDSWQDMMLISHCKHHIMANSTFSWWGSFLGEQPDSIIICPPKFTNKDNGENYPASWIRCQN